MLSGFGIAFLVSPQILVGLLTEPSSPSRSTDIQIMHPVSSGGCTSLHRQVTAPSACPRILAFSREVECFDGTGVAFGQNRDATRFLDAGNQRRLAMLLLFLYDRCPVMVILRRRAASILRCAEVGVLVLCNQFNIIRLFSCVLIPEDSCV